MPHRGIGLSFLNALIELLYPRLCCVCGTGLTRGENLLCTSCLYDFPFFDAALISGDGLFSSFEEKCRPEGFHSLFYYNKYSKYKNLVHAVKYRSQKELGIFLGKMLGERMRGKIQADAIIPVPLHAAREKKRGFNQSQRIACGISEALGIEVWEDVIVRVKDNISQTGLEPEERRRNVENIFELRNPAKINGKHLLVVDDVITTGATVSSCLKVLADAGNVRYTLACLARPLA
ncbi:ComF family protein [Odoribacter lunatus]|uniref:ComF family protein n=1 Tax=Odoribacter lunatus TaxID=2941335 RepID=UPI00203B38E7|nr:ComF family protein [Odoribacter lunatus]